MTCVPDKKDRALYSGIKKLCYIYAPCPSQVITMEVLNKFRTNLNPIAKKVVAQMAAKL